MAKYARPYYRGRGRLGTNMRYKPPLRRAPYRRRARRPLRSANRVVTTIHRIEQYNGGSGDYAIDLVSDTLDVHKHVAPMLSQFPGVGPYKALYHQFKIKKVTAEFFPVNMQGRFNTEDDIAFADLYTPTLYTAINRTSHAFADNITKICSVNTMRSATAGRYHRRVWTPSTLDQVFESVATTGYNPEFGQWISTDDTSVPHFGLDVLLSSTSSPKNSFKYKMRLTVVVCYKNRKANIDLG